MAMNNNGTSSVVVSEDQRSVSEPSQQHLPDSDTIKMFVGQIPRHMDDSDLRRLFEEFGAVYEVNVLRDKYSGQSKGCCFVTFMTRRAALDAQNHLHNVRTLAGMHHPLQMKPADTENRNERKLFVGMVNKQCDEHAVRAMFGRFGTIEECTVLRDQAGHSRGCAFVTLSSRQCAFAAIKSMHHSLTMAGCSAPLVVKFADTQKDKDSRRVQHSSGSANNGGALWPGFTSPFTPQYLQLIQQLTNTQNTAAGTNGPSMAALVAAAMAAAASTQSTRGNQRAADSLHNNTGGTSDGASCNPHLLQQFSQITAALAQTQLSGPAGKREEGPDDCNLFIYHLPQEFTDTDLAQMFMPFGTVISSKVFIDKVTNLSKCFGFVSYDNASSAQSAIQAMNGFQVGVKRLKVQLKRTKESAVSSSTSNGNSF